MVVPNLLKSSYQQGVKPRRILHHTFWVVPELSLVHNLVRLNQVYCIFAQAKAFNQVRSNQILLSLSYDLRPLAEVVRVSGRLLPLVPSLFLSKATLMVWNDDRSKDLENEREPIVAVVHLAVKLPAQVRNLPLNKRLPLPPSVLDPFGDILL